MSHFHAENCLVCSKCGTDWPLDAMQCANCGQAVDETDTRAPDDFPSAAPTSPFSFSIASLLTFTAVIAVCLGLGRIDPILGCIVGALVIPTYVIYACRLHRRRVFGQSLLISDRIEEFFTAGIIYILIMSHAFALVMLMCVGGVVAVFIIASVMGGN